MPVPQEVKYLGIVQDEAKKIFVDPSQASFDAIFARAEELLGKPVFVQILNSTPEAAAEHIENMVKTPYITPLIEYVDSFDDSAQTSGF